VAGSGGAGSVSKRGRRNGRPVLRAITSVAFGAVIAGCAGVVAHAEGLQHSSPKPPLIKPVGAIPAPGEKVSEPAVERDGKLIVRRGVKYRMMVEVVERQAPIVAVSSRLVMEGWKPAEIDLTRLTIEPESCCQRVFTPWIFNKKETSGYEIEMWVRDKNGNDSNRVRFGPLIIEE